MDKVMEGTSDEAVKHVFDSNSMFKFAVVEELEKEIASQKDDYETKISRYGSKMSSKKATTILGVLDTELKRDRAMKTLGINAAELRRDKALKTLGESEVDYQQRIRLKAISHIHGLPPHRSFSFSELKKRQEEERESRLSQSRRKSIDAINSERDQDCMNSFNFIPTRHQTPQIDEKAMRILGVKSIPDVKRDKASLILGASELQIQRHKAIRVMGTNEEEIFCSQGDWIPHSKNNIASPRDEKASPSANSHIPHIVAVQFIHGKEDEHYTPLVVGDEIIHTPSISSISTGTELSRNELQISSIYTR